MLNFTAIALFLLAFVAGYAAAKDRWGVVCVLLASGAVLAVAHVLVARAELWALPGKPSPPAPHRAAGNGRRAMGQASSRPHGSAAR